MNKRLRPCLTQTIQRMTTLNETFSIGDFFWLNLPQLTSYDTFHLNSMDKELDCVLWPNYFCCTV